MDQRFTHLDDELRPSMVNVGQKAVSQRKAVARARVSLPDEVLRLLRENEIVVRKGAVLQTAILAGIMGAKKTGELIPLCHPIGLDNCQITMVFDPDGLLHITCTAEVAGKTGVEMEALTGASIAALTVYDMCKSFSHDIMIRDICLMAKTGGKRDFYRDA